MSGMSTIRKFLFWRDCRLVAYLACLLALALFSQLVPGSATTASAYTNLSPTQVKTMVENGTAGTILDVREYDEYCTAYGGHIPCALNYPWNTGYLQSHYAELDPDATYIVVCRSGNRSVSASSFLESQGFTKIYNMSGGMSSWQGATQTCDEECARCLDAQCPVLYFPHIDCTSGWQTEVALINTSDSEAFSGELRAYRADGGLVDTRNIVLAARGRAEFAVQQAFAHPETIRYLVLTSDVSHVTGYAKFYMAGKYRVSVPAQAELNASRIIVPHIASDNLWWTGIALVNTTDEARDITISFSDGSVLSRNVAAHQHTSFSIRDLFGGAAKPNLTSAVIDNCPGFIGLELFGGMTSDVLSGIPFSPTQATELVFPHVVNDSTWWTGLVAYNPAAVTNGMTVTAYCPQGLLLYQSSQTLNAGQRYFGTPGMLQLPENTAWFRISASQPLAGFELFGRVDVDELAGFSAVGLPRTTGILPKLDPSGWTGVVFVNTEDGPVEITLEAVTNNGQTVATGGAVLEAHTKLVGLAGNFFPAGLGSASYLRFTANGKVAGFQMNGSADETMLDAIPAL